MSESTQAIADAVTAMDGTIASLTEDVMGVTVGLAAIAEAIRVLADAVRDTIPPADVEGNT